MMTRSTAKAKSVRTIYAVFNSLRAAFDSPRRVELGLRVPIRCWMLNLCDFSRVPVKPPPEVICTLPLTVV